MNKKLKELEQYLADINAPILSQLQPGLERTDIISLLNVHKVKNEIIEDLFEWKDGVADPYDVLISQIELVPGLIFQNLESTILEYSNGDHEWDKLFFPIFFSGTGDYFLIRKAVLS